MSFREPKFLWTVMAIVAVFSFVLLRSNDNKGHSAEAPSQSQRARNGECDIDTKAMDEAVLQVWAIEKIAPLVPDWDSDDSCLQLQNNVVIVRGFKVMNGSLRYSASCTFDSSTKDNSSRCEISK
jgi:hypothetical protein